MAIQFNDKCEQASTEWAELSSYVRVCLLHFCLFVSFMPPSILMSAAIPILSIILLSNDAILVLDAFLAFAILSLHCDSNVAPVLLLLSLLILIDFVLQKKNSLNLTSIFSSSYINLNFNTKHHIWHSFIICIANRCSSKMVRNHNFGPRNNL